MRRTAFLLVLALVLVGCSDSVPGGKKVVTPTPVTVIGKHPTPPKAVTGNAAAGKAVFLASGCGNCHVFTPAGSSGTVGPDLDDLASLAAKANQGTLEAFISSSITDPGAYVAPGYQAGLMPSTYGSSLSKQQLADLVAFLAKGP